MINVTKLYCGIDSASDPLRYGHQHGPEHGLPHPTEQEHQSTLQRELDGEKRPITRRPSQPAATAQGSLWVVPMEVAL